MGGCKVNIIKFNLSKRVTTRCFNGEHNFSVKCNWITASYK